LEDLSRLLQLQCIPEVRGKAPTFFMKKQLRQSHLLALPFNFHGNTKLMRVPYRNADFNKVEIINDLKNLRYHRSHFSGCR
jgi:hypothetical protein